jgi:hypothetical protein
MGFTTSLPIYPGQALQERICSEASAWIALASSNIVGSGTLKGHSILTSGAASWPAIGNQAGPAQTKR